MACVVLPPISTDGLTSDNVDELVESTRSAMVKALESISRPGPAHQSDIQVAPEDLQTPRAELPRQLGDASTEDSHARRRNQESSGDASHLGSELSKVDSRGAETTDDEMDDDAVLLKHPKQE